MSQGLDFDFSPLMQQMKIMRTRHWWNYSRQHWLSLASWQPQKKPDALCKDFQHMIDDSSPIRIVSWKWFDIALANPLSHGDFLHINLPHESTRAVILKGRLSRTGQGVSVFVILKECHNPCNQKYLQMWPWAPQRNNKLLPTHILL